jgi:hypothetical protein
MHGFVSVNLAPDGAGIASMLVTQTVSALRTFRKKTGVRWDGRVGGDSSPTPKPPPVLDSTPADCVDKTDGKRGIMKVPRLCFG